MDVLKATSAYVTRMINHPTLTGMRVLILDDFTTQIVAMTVSMGDA
eukprot:CAMPEP_0171954948 /NCGR_PEP_ID=MMETSP0993-20121228/108660_1 /TAXON_ID=483369 /ORGANISM="non described non described, Strain CCMP2098" /LENGTH=45 /DNA_ID= /DNA_START= /DNA_END= /DNA_ORIENTATION=